MRTKLLLISLILFSAGMAHAVAKTLPDNLQLVGQAELKVLWFSIYKARLESPEGRYEPGINPLMLTLEYQRDISKQQLLEETESQWQQAGINKKDQKEWLRLLNDIWPDISKHDSLSFYQDKEGFGHFYFNKAYIGSINDGGFSQAFLNIWLSENSDFPQLTKQLTGRPVK